MTCVTDRERCRTYFKASGDMDSSAFINGHIAGMEDAGTPWLFDRLIDLTACEGHVEYDDFVRLWKYWQPLMRKASGPLKTAIITQNEKTEKRMPLVAMMLQGQLIRTFRTQPEAEAWLDAK